MWNQLRSLRSFSLLCSYVVSSFIGEQRSAGRLPDNTPTCGHCSIASAPINRPTTCGRWPPRSGTGRSWNASCRSSLRELRLHEQRLEARLADSRRAAAEARTSGRAQDRAAGQDRLGDRRRRHPGAGLRGGGRSDPRGAGGLQRRPLVDGWGPGGRPPGSGRRIRRRGCPDVRVNPPGRRSGRDAIVDSIRDRELIWIASRDELVARYPNLAGSVTSGRDFGVVCLPVVTPGQAVGAIGLTFEDARALDDEEAQFLLLIARYSGQALERLRLLAVEQQNRVRAELLYGLVAAVIGADRVEEHLRCGAGRHRARAGYEPSVDPGLRRRWGDALPRLAQPLR